MTYYIFTSILNYINYLKKQIYSQFYFYRSLKLLTIFICFSLSSCYNVTKEIIPSNLGEVIPYKHGITKLDNGLILTITKSNFNNDYKYKKTGTIKYNNNNKSVDESGRFRAMRLKEDIYIIQAIKDDEHTYYILFYSIKSDSFSRVEPSESADIKSIAKKFNVTIDEDELDFFGAGDEWLNGTPIKILEFLRALHNVDFVVS